MGNENAKEVIKESSLAELEDVLKRLPKDLLAFAVAGDQNGLTALIQGEKIEVSALLCRLQEKEAIVEKILEVAVVGFKLAQKEGRIHDPRNKRNDINVN